MPPPLRLQIVVNSLGVGGAERHAVDLAVDLTRLGDEVHIVYLAPRHTLLESLPPPVQARSVCVPRASAVDVAAVRELARLRRSCRPEVVLTVNHYPQVLHRLSCLFGNSVPVVAVQHSMAYPGDSELKLAFAKAALSAADALVYLSARQLAYWRARGVSARREPVIPNGVDLERFSPPSAAIRAQARSRIGAASGDLVIGVCAGLREEKRHESLLQAAARLVAGGLPVRLVLVGDGPRRAMLEALAEGLGLAGRVLITGYVHHVEEWMAGCDVACLSSTHETLPLALIEAQAMGLPAVATRAGATADIVNDGCDGYLVDVDDIEALAASLARLADGKRRAAFGEAGRRNAQLRFDRRRMVEAYRELFADLVDAESATAV